MKTKFEFAAEKSDVVDELLSLNTNDSFKFESLIRSNPADSFSTSGAAQVIPELSHPVIGKFSGIFAKLNSMSVNRRFYSKNFWIKVLDSYPVLSDLESGKMLAIFEHPNVTENYTKEGIATARHPMNSAFVVKRLWIDGDDVMGEAYILNTPLGRLLATYFLAKDEKGKPLIQLFISARGYTQKDYFDQNGIDHMNPDDYRLQTFDVVMNPGIKGARVKLESDDKSTNEELAKLESFSEEVKRYYDRQESIKNDLRSELNLKTV